MNYYYHNPTLNFWLLEKAFGTSFDALAATQLLGGNDIMRQELKKLADMGIDTMISELQMEPWGSSTLPGESVHGLQYALIRTMRCLNFPAEVHVWGIEYFLEKIFTHSLSTDQEEMVSLIKVVNELE